MSQCMCCLNQAVVFISLTCSHFICRQCFNVVKCGSSVFCTVCCHMSEVQTEPTETDGLTYQDCSADDYAELWETATAKKFSAISIGDVGSITSETFSVPSTSSTQYCGPDFSSVAGVIQNLLQADNKVVLPKFGQHRAPPDHFWCSIQVIETPKNISVCIHDDELERFSLMNAKMQEVYESMPRVTKQAKCLKLGSCYSIKRGGVWFRAEIRGISNMVGLALVDAGDRYYVYGEHHLTVQELTPEFLELPAQAVCCDLDTPPRCRGHGKQKCSGLTHTCWNSECLKFLNDKRNATALCLVNKSRPYGEYNELSVTMYIDNEAKSLNQRVIENKWSCKSYTTSVMAKFDVLNALRKDIIANEEIPEFVKLSRKQMKPMWIFTSPADALPKEFEGLVTWVDDRGGVYIHTCDWSSKLIYMRDRLKETFSSDDDVPESLETGDCCFVKYKGNWFRAIFNEYISRERGKVFFVDFGAVELVLIKDIRCKNMFFKIPVQTFRCFMDGIDPINERTAKGRHHFSESAVNLLYHLTVNCEFHVTVENVSPLRVSLKFPNNDVTVASLLVAAHKAKYREMKKTPTRTPTPSTDQEIQ